jgi:F-box protein 9
VQVWGVAAAPPCWRQAFLTRPTLHYAGCYVSKITYIREGERGFQDQNYRPWHVVEYHRFLRFFPGGQVTLI